MDISNSRVTEKTVYVVNCPDELDEVFYDSHSRINEMAKPFVYLREEIEGAGFKFKTTADLVGLTDIAAIVSITNIRPAILQNIAKYPKSKCFLIIFEPPTVRPEIYDPRLKHFFGTIFTMFDSLVDHRTYHKFYHYQLREKMVENIPDFSHKKLCVMIHSHLQSGHPNELYSERERVAIFFAKSDELDLYGRFWDGFPNWKGFLSNDKISLLKNYKFCFCYENMRNQLGYITERIFDAMFGGSVPIYWGADNITDYVPKECFVDRRNFSSNQDLYNFIKSVDRITYENYLADIKKYLSNSGIGSFASPRCFGQVIVQSIVSILSCR